MDGVLVRFGEIGIKSQPVRRMMQSRLRNNLLDMMLREGIEGDVQSRGARLWMVGPDTGALLDVAARTFGVVSASPCRTCAADMDAMGRVAGEAAVAVPGWTSFAVRARRQGEHGFTSQDIGVEVGSAVHVAATATGKAPRVDLSSPDLEIHVEVRDRTAYVSTQTLAGPGGLPLGSQGTVLCLVSDTASAVAAWLMMRRGCTALALHAGDMGSAPVDLLGPLQRWGLGPDVTLLPVCGRATTKAALLDAAAAVAQETGAAALVTGDGLESILCPASLPVLRPVMGLPQDEVERLRQRIDLPVEDGADLLVPEGGDSSDELLRMKRVVTV